MKWQERNHILSIAIFLAASLAVVVIVWTVIGQPTNDKPVAVPEMQIKKNAGEHHPNGNPNGTGSPAEAANGKDVSYLQNGDLDLYSCDHTNNGKRATAEGQTNRGNSVWVTDLDGAGGECYRTRSTRDLAGHREYATPQATGGGHWSGHPG